LESPHADVEDLLQPGADHHRAGPAPHATDMTEGVGLLARQEQLPEEQDVASAGLPKLRERWPVHLPPSTRDTSSAATPSESACTSRRSAKPSFQSAVTESGVASPDLVVARTKKPRRTSRTDWRQ
jgi:hypothetical protein